MLLDVTLRRIAAKELTLFFASPVAYLFLATFAAVSLFIFFWGEAFFARNIADVRPLFEWMPVLLIFLAAALTMRMWSEERRSGTLEHVLTQPVALWRFVAGKFLACLALLAIALLITLPLPVTVALIGNLDWGPVWAGYLATFLLGAAYLSVGLFVSARSDNQIVSLIATALVCGVLYLLGSPLLTDLMGNQAGEWLRALGSGSRFESITRGVIDLRDLYYYLSLIAVFLTLNVFALERERWAASGNRQHHRAWRWGTALVIANALGVNLWLGQITALRVDTTEGNLYSISDATQGYLDRLQEPLLIRGYFSAKTHPLLAPLAPQLQDLIREYEAAGQGRVRVEFIDPATQPELEEEANQKYGISPVPFQVNDRYQSSLVNSYFNVVVQYGDEFQTLGFRDLIEVKADGETDLDVQLRNPEYDITRAIKKVLYAYQSGGNLFDSIQGELTFTGYVSPDKQLPPQLVDFRQMLEKELDSYVAQSGQRLKVRFVDPQANGGQVAEQIARDYGFTPMVDNLLDSDSFYFHLTLSQGEQVVQLPLGELEADAFRRSMDAGLKRFASGFTKTVALVAPQADPRMARFGQMPMGPQFSQLQQFLGEDLNVRREDLGDGRVGSDADILLLAAPKELDDKQLFAVDQFLMRGGTVIAATSPFSAQLERSGFRLQRHTSGLKDWLAHHGLQIDDKLVMDPQNVAFPVPVTRQAGGFSFQELHMLDYPYFVDVRGSGLNDSHPMTADLPQATLAWASPIRVDDKQSGREITELLSSSGQAWLSEDLDIMPRIGQNGRPAYTPEGEQGQHRLGVISEGQFQSYFAGKESPLLETADTAGKAGADSDAAEEDTQAKGIVSGVIEHSPESARIILLASNDFLRDQVVRLAGSNGGSEYLNTLQLTANAIDWSLADRGLLSIRSRGHFNRTLPPMSQDSQRFWEYLNYALALAAIGAVALVQTQRRRARNRRYLELQSA